MSKIAYRLAIVLLGLCFVFNSVALPVFAATAPAPEPTTASPLPNSEIEALSKYPNWVAQAACDTSGASSGGGGGTLTVGNEVPDNQLPGNSVRQKIWNYLIAQGWTPVQAAGIMGNIAVEGVWDPTNIEDPAGSTKDPSNLTGQTQGWGLFGFTPGASIIRSGPWTDWTVGGKSPVKVNKDDVYYISTQLDVVYYYMKYYNNEMQDYINQATSPDTAAIAFMNIFENPLVSVSHDARRENAANKAMKDFGNGGVVGSSTTGTTGTTGAGAGDSGTCCAPGSIISGGGPSVNNIYILGDSITEAATGAYKSAFQAQGVDNVNIDASVSRGIDTPGTTGNKLSGLDAITHDADEIKQADAVVVALGTNGGATPQDIDKTISEIQSINPDADIFWVDTISVGRSDNFNQTIVGPTNQAIRKEAANEGYQIISWFKAVDPDGNPGQPTKSETDPNGYINKGDSLGVHPTSDGSQALAKLVLAAIGSPTSSSGAPSGECCAGSTGGTTTLGPGTLPSSVPDPYNKIFTAAANKFNISPAFLAAVFYGGEHGNSFPDPPPPYGHGSPWASSGVASSGSSDWPTQPPGPGAAGPFQFEYPTWQSNEQDGNGDGKKDVEDLTDASFAGAKLLAALGAKNTTDESKLRQAAADYNGIGDPNASYPSLVWDAFQKFGGPSGGVGGGAGGGTGPATPAASPTTGGCAAGSTTGYQNPLRDITGLGAARIDQGVDYTGDGPIYAIGNGTVDYVNTGSGWPGENGSAGTFLSYILNDGSAAGKRVYVAENCTDVKVHVGQTVDSSTVLCTLHNVFPYLETGWGDQTVKPPVDLAAAYVAYGAVPDGTATAYGKNFSDLLKSLGAPAGIYQFSDQQGGKNLAGTVPNDWPTW